MTSAFYGAPLGMALVSPDGRWIEVNDALCELLDQGRDALVDHSWNESVHERERLAARTWISGLIDASGPDRREIRFTRPDSTVLHLVVSASVIRAPSGAPKHLVVHLQDDTRRKEQQQELLESEALYRTLADSFPGGSVLLFDRDLRYRIAGGAALEDVGLEQSELEGKTVWEALPEGVADVVADQYRATLAGEEIVAEMPFRDRVLYTQNVPVRNEAGDIVAGMVITLDITERKRTEEELERSNQDLEQFAYVASHDLREPLRMVTSYCQLLQRRYQGKLDADADEFIHYAVDGAQRMQVLIDDLLAFSRAGRAEEGFHLVACDQVLEQVLFDLQLAIDDAGAQVLVEPLPVVEGDPGQLAQVFRNLIGNAIKFRGDRPPRVAVCAHRDGDVWIISVADNGIGIDPDHQERVFEVFQRLHGRGEYPGTGIGLAIAKRVLESHGGAIELESEPGRGSTFYLSLPAVHE